jgi:hypothetical protein
MLILLLKKYSFSNDALRVNYGIFSGLPLVHAPSNSSSNVTSNESITDTFSFWLAESFWPNITQFVITGLI